jgi:hypothetical protein
MIVDGVAGLLLASTVGSPASVSSPWTTPTRACTR